MQETIFKTCNKKRHVFKASFVSPMQEQICKEMELKFPQFSGDFKMMVNLWQWKNQSVRVRLCLSLASSRHIDSFVKEEKILRGTN